MTKEKLIFHIDVNSAYLSWSAVDMLCHGETSDIRTIPSAVGGNVDSRHGIILAKSIPCKKYNIKTGESIYEAKQKCKDLLIVPPHYDIYLCSSNAMFELLSEYTNKIQRYSIDEVFVDVTDLLEKYNYIDLANEIRCRIRDELGFTVCVGISTNKLLAKMATELKKPDATNTLFLNELEKMWCLPVGDLFMVGRASERKLKNLGIKTIDDLRKTDIKVLESHLKSHGRLIWNYANGIEYTNVTNTNLKEKSIGNSTTISFDIDNYTEAYLVLLSLTESVCTRLRNANLYTRLISVSICTNDFKYYSHQRKIFNFTNSTNEIYSYVKDIFNEAWVKGDIIRKLGVRVSCLSETNNFQLSLFDTKDRTKIENLDKTIDKIRAKYGNKSVFRTCFIDNEIKPISGGVGEEGYLLFSQF